MGSLYDGLAPILERRYVPRKVAVEINIYSKPEAIRFDGAWRAALRAQRLQRSKFGAPELLVWRERARLGVEFAQDGGPESGSIAFDADEAVPHPSELCEQLGFGSVWFFGDSYAWAVRTGHQDWQLAELFEKPPDSELLS